MDSHKFTLPLRMLHADISNGRDFTNVLRDAAKHVHRQLQEDLTRYIISSTPKVGIVFNEPTSSVSWAQPEEYHCPECATKYGNSCKEDKYTLSTIYTYACHKCGYTWTETLFEEYDDDDEEEEACADQAEPLQPGQA